MFPFAETRSTVEEARRFYSLYEAESNLYWITKPEEHGNLSPISPAILSFFVANLKASEPTSPFTPLRASQTADMIVTPSGQVSTSIGGKTVYSINRTRAQAVLKPSPTLSEKSDLQKLQTRLQQNIR